MLSQQPPVSWRGFFIGWFLLCAVLNALVATGFCQWFVMFQDTVVPGADAARLMQSCTATWQGRYFPLRYALFVAAGLGVAFMLWRFPQRGVGLAQGYLLAGVLLRFMFNVFPHTGPDAGLFPLPPGTSTDPPVYLMPVAVGVVTGFLQITVFSLLLLQRRVRKTEVVGDAALWPPPGFGQGPG